EFLRVNNVPQQGLVRFARRDIAPNKLGPVLKDTAFPLSAVSYASGQVRLGWTGNYDLDDAALEYRVYRSSTTGTPIDVQTVTAPFWNEPRLTFTDTGLAAGSSQRYRVVALDRYGNQAMSPWATVTVSSEQLSSYAAEVLSDAPTSFWRLGESSGTTGYDWAGAADLTVADGVTRGAAGAIGGDTNTASTFGGTSSGLAVTPTAIDGPNTFTAEAWFKTTTTSGGKILGFGSSATSLSSSYDRHVYMADNGRIYFGVYPGSVRTIASTSAYNDGEWHQVVASLGSGGMQLWVDGKRVAQRTDTTSAQDYLGYWRIGGDNLASWPGAPTSNYVAGTIDDVAIYPTVLSGTQVRSHYVASGRTLDVPSAPTDAYGTAVYNAEPNLYWRFDETTGSQLADSGVEDHQGALNGAFTRVSSGALVGVTGDRAVTFGPGAGNAYSVDQVDNPTSYSLEAWFSTTSSSGGKIIGFGNAQTGLSSNYDRHVYMQDDGTLVFGVWTGQPNTITSASSYNDGRWHYVLATQDGSGMRLYVDGQPVGSNPQSASQAYTGYWRVAGDTTWGSSSPYLAGSYDEVAVYPRALSANDAQIHYSLGTTGTAPNLLPSATFQPQLEGRTVTVDGSGSSDPDGTVQTYVWDFGDGQTAVGPTAGHTYTNPGSYTILLTVTDDRGGTATAERVITVTNAAPTAAFTTSSQFLTLSVDGSGSLDPDGTVAAYEWDFGDGATATVPVTQHTYASAGTYTVTLTVTDNDGAVGTMSQTVAVAQNQAPVASFTPTVAGLSVSVDGTSSADPEGSLASYSWSFGDGGTATGATAQHTFAVAGTYPVALTVADAQGLTGTATQQVTVATDVPFAVDSFSRTVTNGWGTADAGGLWTLSGSSSQYGVSAGSGKFTIAAAGYAPRTQLRGVTVGDVDVSSQLSLDKIGNGGGTFVSLTSRGSLWNSLYRGKVWVKSTGAVNVSIGRLTGTETTLVQTNVAGLTLTAGAVIRVRFETEG
ncbi:MAG: PKD domain-containing protein, partial [Cellulomonas sp.]